ncbi:outer membrane beta-barrel family protein [Mucilaginibacter sp.]|uniref:outer membrane beta-barrel family protein n=1 Tax=Mucilaginibacter sp. TaxID=1882438 RepID=UPI0028529794|nr:outer membrane beta-barrel family protein [Mucilaginibacter sp.]
MRVSPDGVSIIGKSTVAVMINERIVNLGGADLVNYLKSLRADDVSKIEVITTPPAKYDAQGNSGLINIVLKKNPALGWSGSLSSSYAQNTYPSFTENGTLNYQSAKLSGSLKLRYYHREGVIGEETDVIGTNSILSHDPRNTLAKGIGGNLSLDYKVSKTAAIGLIYDRSKTNYDVHLNNTTTYQTDNHIDSVLTTRSLNCNPVTNQTLNLYYDQKLDNSGRKMTTGINYFSNDPTTNIDFQTASDHSPTPETVRTYSGIQYKIWSAQSDLTLPFSWAMVETGAKLTNFDNNADVRYYNYIEQRYLSDTAKSNLFNYNEKDIAAYLSLQKNFSKKWAAKAGLRYEYAIIDGYSPTTNTENRSDYGKLFPSAYITYKPDAKNTFSFNYSERISRPSFRAINPFRAYINPYTYYTGNPLLQPSFNHNLELSYLYNGIFSLSVYGQRLVNGYGYLVEVNGPYKITDAANYLTQNSAGVVATLSLKLFPWWENSSYASFSVSNSGSSLPQVITENGSAFNYSTSNTFTVSKKVSLFLNYSQSLPARQSNSYRANQFSLLSGLRISFYDNRLQFNASVFRGSVDKGIIYFKGYNLYNTADYDYKTLNLGFTYLFGRPKVKGNAKKIDFKETQRAN